MRLERGERNKMRNFLGLIFVALLVDGVPVNPEEEPYVSRHFDEESYLLPSHEENNSTPSGGKDLYVIKKVVYEIGILTDADNSTEYDNKTHEQIDISFFDPLDNGTVVDLSHIPIPVEANVSGVALTGILPSNFGSLVFPANGTAVSLNESNIPVFPEKQVKIVKNISTVDKEQSANILSGISEVLGLSKIANLKDERKEEEEKHLLDKQYRDLI